MSETLPAMSDTTIAPSPGLTNPVDPASGQKSRFILFSESWIELQAYTGAAIALPITQDEFATKYGSFSGEQVIKDCITAMRGVQATATEFGNPKTLRASLIQNPNLLATAQPPDEIYTHTVWLGQKIHNTSQTLASGFKTVLDEVSSLPKPDQVEAIKAFLFDATLGPIPLGKSMSDEAGKLIKKLGTFEQKMNEYNEKLQAFTKSSSSMLALVNSTIGSIEQKIADLEKTRDDAYKAWKDFTIAAVTTSVGCFLIGAVLAPFTGGASLLVGGAAAIATGVGLGVKAARCRAEYNAACQMIDEETAEKQKKIRLRSDLGDFNTAMGRVGPAMNKFLKDLQTVEGIWVQMNSDMLHISEMVNEGNVGTIPFLVKAKAQAAIDAWKGVDESAKQFTVQSLVDYDGLAFGDQMPEARAAA
jgi:hypothetical protein